LPLLDGTKHPALDQLALMRCGYEVALVAALPRRPLGKRLRALGLEWSLIDEAQLEAVREDFKDIELIWPKPVGDQRTASDEYQMSIRLRLGMDRDRKALPHALRACELEPNDHYHWVELGFVHGELDQLPEKLAAMDRAIEISPERWGGWAGRGTALRDLGRFDEARATFESGLALDPKRGRLHYELGLVLARIASYDDALAAFERTVEHAVPENRAWYLGIVAQFQLEHGRLADVAATLARARQLGSPGFRIARLTGYERLFSGAPSEALAIATGMTGPAHREDELFMLALRAAALRELDRGDEAAAIYHQIVDTTDCPTWIAFAWLGLALVGVEPPQVTAATDPLDLADAIAAHVNARRETPRVHDTVDRCNDRIRVALAMIAAATVSGRHDEARGRATAFGRYLAGPAPVKLIDWWMELAELVRTVARRHPAKADLLATCYQVATGRQPPSALL
jgi:tetratricopeptide (TPR) repeat protein